MQGRAKTLPCGVNIFLSREIIIYLPREMLPGKY